MQKLLAQKFETELVPSPRPLPPHMMVTPQGEEKRRNSLDGNYELSYGLGRGATGSVTLATDRRTGEQVAVKIINKASLRDEQEIRIRREYAIMKHVNHKNLVRLINVIENPKEICIVMEYASSGDLYTHIISSPNMRLSEKEARKIFYQAARGLYHLHRCGFVHRDIKPENILLDRDRVLIGDFGYGTTWEENKRNETACGSLYYASPEIVQQGGTYIGPEVDVWSLGCVLFVMTAGRLPFHGEDANETRELIIKGIYSTPFHFSPQLKHLISGMLALDPKERLRMEDVVKHQWVTGGKQSTPILKRRRRSLSEFSIETLRKIRFWASNEKNNDPTMDEDKEKQEKQDKQEKQEKLSEPPFDEADDNQPGKQKGKIQTLGVISEDGEYEIHEEKPSPKQKKTKKTSLKKTRRHSGSLSLTLAPIFEEEKEKEKGSEKKKGRSKKKSEK
jgi:serine/threonine protein kinase